MKYLLSRAIAVFPLFLNTPNVILAILSLWYIPNIHAEGKRPPNIIIIIMADDMGYGGLSCYDNRYYQTPKIDRLAADGLLLSLVEQMAKERAAIFQEALRDSPYEKLVAARETGKNSRSRMQAVESSRA